MAEFMERNAQQIEFVWLGIVVGHMPRHRAIETDSAFLHVGSPRYAGVRCLRRRGGILDRAKVDVVQPGTLRAIVAGNPELKDRLVLLRVFLRVSPLVR